MYRLRTYIKNKSRAKSLAKALVMSRAAVIANIREVDSVSAMDGRISIFNDFEVEAIYSNPDLAYSVVMQNHPYTTPVVMIDEVMIPQEIEGQMRSWCRISDMFRK